MKNNTEISNHLMVLAQQLEAQKNSKYNSMRKGVAKNFFLKIDSSNCFLFQKKISYNDDDQINNKEKRKKHKFQKSYL